MQVIIKHDKTCDLSDDGLYRWQLAFEAMQRESRKEFSAPDAMHAHADKWAELARALNCNCGASAEIKRREEEAERAEPRADVRS